MTKTINVDVMICGGDKFYQTVSYPYTPLFRIDFEDIQRHVYSRLPTLKYRKDVVLVVENKYI